ncbi:MAG: hypothetical protein HY078_07520 [Elusimicrobia bacterium]|nr:hypothetical protein [Elusimicrobiota bacterium]
MPSLPGGVSVRRGSFPWPGRLDLRERILIESRSVKELIDKVSPLKGEFESVMGRFEYLWLDWCWLHEPGFRARHPFYVSVHKSQLRCSSAYVEAIEWRGEIPDNELVIESWEALDN